MFNESEVCTQITLCISRNYFLFHNLIINHVHGELELCIHTFGYIFISACVSVLIEQISRLQCFTLQCRTRAAVLTRFLVQVGDNARRVDIAHFAMITRQGKNQCVLNISAARLITTKVERPLEITTCSKCSFTLICVHFHISRM